ncbi:MAG: alpha/beta fold hydrolase [Flavobacteriia bacterium]|nr:alpha/beta fold hydrolase [Flavobacteriia bacterium]
MKNPFKTIQIHSILLFCLSALFNLGATAQNFYAQKTGVWETKNFQFHTGETLPSVKLGYTTLGDPANEAVVILHGTAGTSAGMLNPAFGGQLFGPGQVLDAQKYYVIIPDAIGAGTSSKPSDGLKAKFPEYNYDDMVKAQYLLIKEGLGVNHLRMVLGNSMGGMQTWLWGIHYPDFMDLLVPMASTPGEMSGRNWMMRRLIVDSIRNDPAWMNGNYTEQPKSALFSTVFYATATNGGNMAIHKQAPTRAAADALLNQRLKGPLVGDATDIMYQWDSSKDYNPTPHLSKIKARVWAINAADDERNPPELGIMEKALSQIPGSSIYLIPASDQTSGHGTTGQAKWWNSQLAKVLESTPRR